jgi:Fur family ferric uptake transcriptional regulator
MLRDAGLKRTPVRISVLDLLVRAGKTLSAPEILARFPRGTDKVTLYRTLNRLTEVKLLHRVRGDDQVWRYGIGDLGPARHEHAHFVCDACGTVECLPGSPTKPVRRARLRSGYNVAYSEVLVHGTCPACHG